MILYSFQFPHMSGYLRLALPRSYTNYQRSIYLFFLQDICIYASLFWRGYTLDMSAA